jgi:NAD(P)-dependent dehydrogenase (short-subunit alcohol dehydrogenase family)
VERWTVTEIPDLDGTTAIVTGANSGLGFEDALQLSLHGAHVVVACRNQTKGAEAVSRIAMRSPKGTTELAQLDLADLASVRTFVADFTSGHDGLDLLINNAGVMALPYRQTADGFEMQLGTNHLGHFALTGLLLPSLLARPGARVVTVSSHMARIGRIWFNNLQGERRYSKWLAYGQSKLANLLFFSELARRIRTSGMEVISVAAHPGYAATNLQEAGPTMQGHRQREKFFQLGNRIVAQSAAMGALPTLYAATSPLAANGDYYGPNRLFENRGYPKQVSLPRAARNVDTARRLWDISEQLTGVTYNALGAVP